MHRLLERSLRAWRLIGRVERLDPGGIAIDGLGRRIVVRRAGPGDPFRWWIESEGRTRPAISAVAVLRQVRSVLDPGYRPARVRIAAPVQTG